MAASKKSKKKDYGITIKTISFTAADQELLNHAADKGPFSNYIKSLIKKDMTADAGTLTKEEVIKLINEAIKGLGEMAAPALVFKKEEAAEIENGIDQDAASEIMRILGGNI